MLSGRGLRDGLITRPEESYRRWCIVVCDLETHSFTLSKLQLRVYSHVIHNLIFPYRLRLYIQQTCHHKPYQLELSPHLDTPTVLNFFHCTYDPDNEPEHSTLTERTPPLNLDTDPHEDQGHKSLQTALELKPFTYFIWEPHYRPRT